VLDGINQYGTTLGELLIAAVMLLTLSFIYYLTKRHRRRLSLFLMYGLVVTALSYLVLAMFSADPLLIAIEVVGSLLFLSFVWLAYQYSFWFLAMGWLLHIAWDMGAHPFGSAPYVPGWYPVVCAAIDLVIGLYLMYLLVRRSRRVGSSAV